MDYTVHGILQARMLERVAFPSLGHLPNPGIEPRSPSLQVDFLPAEPQGKPTISQSLLKLMSMELIMPSKHVQPYATMCNHDQYLISELFHHPQKKLCTLQQSLPLLLPSHQQPLIYFLLSYICLFWTFQIHGIIQYVVFCVWLLSFSMLIFSVHHVVSYIKTLVMFLNPQRLFQLFLSCQLWAWEYGGPQSEQQKRAFILIELREKSRPLSSITNIPLL